MEPSANESHAINDFKLNDKILNSAKDFSNCILEEIT